VLLTNHIRDIGLTLRSSSTSSMYDPKTDILSSIQAEHFPRKWYGVYSQWYGVSSFFVSSILAEHFPKKW